MAVKIRLKKMGSKKRPFFRVVAADSRSPRDGRFIETLGHYNPLTDPPEIVLDHDKVFKWLGNGAQPTQNAADILRKAGLLERFELLKRGVAIADIDATIEEMRAKQPQAKVRTGKKLSKKAAAKLEAEKEKAAEAAAAPEPEETPAEATEAPAEEAGGETGTPAESE